MRCTSEIMLTTTETTALCVRISRLINCLRWVMQTLQDSLAHRAYYHFSASTSILDSNYRTLWFSRRSHMRFLGHNASWHSVLHDLCDLELIYCIRNSKFASSHFFHDVCTTCNTHILAHICWLAIEFNWLAIDVRLLCDDQQQLKSGLGSPFTQFESLITHNVLDLSDFGASPYSKWIHISNFWSNAKRNLLYIQLLFDQLSWL